MVKVNPIIAGLRCKCPNCGGAPLFNGFLKVRLLCEACGQDLSQADSGDGPVVFILLIVGAIGCFGVLGFEVAFHPPIWVQIMVWLPLIAAITLAVLRPFKAIFIALQFHNRAAEARSDEERAP